MSEAIGMTREEIITALILNYVSTFTDANELRIFVSNVLMYGWDHKPYDQMDNFELFAEWNDGINRSGNYPIFITDMDNGEA